MGHSSISQPFTASQARLIGRCSVGGRLYRPPFPACQPTPISPTHRQLDPPPFPGSRPTFIAPTPWRLYRPPFPVGNRTALAPTRSRLIGRRSACGPRPLGMGYPPPVLARDGQRVSEADRRPLAMNCYPRRKPIGGPSVPFGTTNWTNQVRRKT